MRRFAIAGIVLLFAVVGGATIALSALTSEDRPAKATVSTFEPRVAVGNESEDAFAGSGAVVTCNEQEPMPGNAGLSGSLVLERPPRRRRSVRRVVPCQSLRWRRLARRDADRSPPVGRFRTADPIHGRRTAVVAERWQLGDGSSDRHDRERHR